MAIRRRTDFIAEHDVVLFILIFQAISNTLLRIPCFSWFRIPTLYRTFEWQSVWILNRDTRQIISEDGQQVLTRIQDEQRSISSQQISTAGNVEKIKLRN